MSDKPVVERAEGWMVEVDGKIEKNIGRLVGNEKMEDEGKAKELKGQARQEVAKAAQRIKGKIEEVKGQARQKINR